MTSEPDPRDDADLLVARDRSDETFAVFYRRHVGAVLALCARRRLDAFEAADVTAETFAAALLSRRRFRPSRGSARSWLLQIAANKIADRGRRRGRERRALDRLALEPVQLSQSDRDEYEELLAREAGTAATDALGELPAAQREAVAARVLDGQPYDAIAARLGVSEPVARQRVSRGLATLRARLSERGHPPATSEE